MNCTYQELHGFSNYKDACDYLKNCNYEYDYFNLLTFNYCIAGNRQYITWPMIALVFLLCFYFLSTSVDEYVSRIVGRMSVKLNMSQNLAGLTLLAFGNQVADITVAIVSGGEEEEGIEASLSTILGADSLVIGFVMPTVIFLGNGVIVKGQNFTRDLLTYLIALILIFSLGIIYRKLNLIFGIIIFSLYIAYVGLCIIMERIENRKKSLKNNNVKKERNENESIGQDEHHEFRVKLFDDDEEKQNEDAGSINQNESVNDEDDDQEKNKREENEKKKEENEKNKEENEEKKEENKEKKEDNIEKKEKKKGEDSIIKVEKEKKKKKKEKEDKKPEDSKKDKDKDKNSKKEEHNDDKDLDAIDILSDKMSLLGDIASLGGPVIFNIHDFLNDKYYLNKSSQIQRKTSLLIGEKKFVYNRLHYTLAKYYLNSKEEKWSDISFFKKILKIFVEFPLNLIRDLTTPPFEKEKWKKEFFALMPISISLFLSLIFGLFKYYIKFPHFIIISAYYVLLIVICIHLYKRSYRGSLPNCEWVLLISALIMSMVWIYTATKILVQMINDSQFLLPFEVSRSFLIMTVLAVGNALPDFLIDITLSRSGFAEMALSGTIGSPVFSLLFGYGLSLIKTFTFSEIKEQTFDLLNFTPSTKVILCAIAGIFINLVHYMLIFSLVNYRVKRYVSYAGFCVFFGYLISLFLVSFVFK